MTDLPEPEPAPETPPPEPAAAPGHDMFSAADPADVAALAARSAPRMLRRNFFSDMPDRGLFIIFAGLGFIGILSLKLNGAQGWWTVAIPLLLMVTYAGITWYGGMFRLHPDRLGDNCYYMGFLFTLASLTAALLEVESRPIDAQGTLLEALIGNFGVALLSTIMGIALRVIFIQMRHEVEEIEDQVRLELQDAAARLKDQLGMAVLDMESFRLRTQQMLMQRLDEANATFANLQRQQAANLQHVVDEEKTAAEALLSVQQRITGNLERAADLQSAATARVAALTETAVQGVEGLIRRIEAIDVPPDLVLRQIDSARERIAALAVALEDIVTADRARQAQFIRATAEMAEQMQGIVSAVAATRIEASAGHLQQAVETMAASVAALHTGLDRYAMSVERLSAATEAERAAMASARGIIETDARHSTRALHDLQATLVEIADAIVRRLETRR
ncbi:MAG TPA: hypothetical protein VGG99_13190 [Acetobacteraceae bacterium]|jgi:hypothetical protein